MSAAAADPAIPPERTKKGRQKGRQRPSNALPRTAEDGEVLITPCSPTAARYYVRDGLRRVEPYFFTYNTWCKERWRDQKLIDIFAAEFRDKPIEYYRSAIERGTVAVNGRFVKTDYVVRNGDLVSHSTHRHEPPVTPDRIGIIHEDDEILVINKPSGVPVHPAGRYNFNTVLEILKEQLKQRRQQQQLLLQGDGGGQTGDGDGDGLLLYPCNRLDRLTSGLMFVAKSGRAAETMRQQITGRTVRKEYVARVVGRFPDCEVVCDRPILQISPKVGLNRVRATGKAARTVFKRLAYYPPPPSSPGVVSRSGDGHDDDPGPTGGYSIVRAMPVTGRTHQIRVHLQFLGHPVQNDPIYANRRVWGHDLGRDDPDGSLNTDEDIITRLSRMGKEEVADAVAYHDEMVDQHHRRMAERMSGELCALCEAPLYTDPGVQELSLWLHSLRYEDIGGRWSYISPLPEWALPPSGQSGPTEVGSMDELADAAQAAEAARDGGDDDDRPLTGTPQEDLPEEK